MFKKLGFVATFIFIISLLCAVSFAVPSNEVISSKVNEKNIAQTKQFIVTITKPEGKDVSVYKKSYVVSGNTDQKNVTVALFIYKNGKFEELKNVDGESAWNIGESGVFIKEVVLPQMGQNKIRIVAYKKNEDNNYNPGVNLQINDFTVTWLEESIKDKIKDGFIKFGDMLTDIFK